MSHNLHGDHIANMPAAHVARPSSKASKDGGYFPSTINEKGRPSTSQREINPLVSSMDSLPHHHTLKWHAHHDRVEAIAPDGGNGGGRRKRTVASGLSKGRAFTGIDGEKERLTKVGEVYEAVINFNLILRYLVYVVPFSALLAIPIIVGSTVAKHANIGGVRIVWFFTWLEIVWGCLWISKLIAKTFPLIYQVAAGFVSTSTRKYYKVIQSLEFSLSLVGCGIGTLVSFYPMMTIQQPLENGKRGILPWMHQVQCGLAGALISTAIFLAKNVVMQIVQERYRQTRFAYKIKTNKGSAKLLARLYDYSRGLYPDHSAEFVDEDRLLLGNRSMVPGADMLQENLTAVVGGVAKEIAGTAGGATAFNPKSSYGVVLNAIEKNCKGTSEALAKRIWMSFVEDGQTALFQNDLVEVLGGDDRAHMEAKQAFAVLDHDHNGDVTLEEMIAAVNEISRESRALGKSIGDIQQTSSDLNILMTFVAAVICVFIFVGFYVDSVKSVFNYASSLLLGTGFAFSGTIQDLVGSIIFIFVKHPYDVGDRVDIDGSELVVEQIALLYTVFRNISTNKMCQQPNNILNAKQVDNVSRSGAMLEIVKVNVNFGTTAEEVDILKEQMQKFVETNPRDFRVDNLDVDVTAFAMDRLEISVQVQYKGNWADQLKRQERRSKFMRALIDTLRLLPLYGPNCGDPSLGDGGNPSFSVSISAAEAMERIQDAKAAKQAKKFVRPQHPTVIEPEAREDQAPQVSGLRRRNEVYGGAEV